MPFSFLCLSFLAIFFPKLFKHWCFRPLASDCRALVCICSAPCHGDSTFPFSCPLEGQGCLLSPILLQQPQNEQSCTFHIGLNRWGFFNLKPFFHSWPLNIRGLVYNVFRKKKLSLCACLAGICGQIWFPAHFQAFSLASEIVAMSLCNFCNFCAIFTN